MIDMDRWTRMKKLLLVAADLERVKFGKNNRIEDLQLFAKTFLEILIF